MAEWLKAAVLKTVSRRRDVGSNPTPSATLFVPVGGCLKKCKVKPQLTGYTCRIVGQKVHLFGFCFQNVWRDGRVG